ncbi:hypothetical protein H0A36_17100 [Endozoicomonas sp. SM1973]|uniref:Major outer membrane lipoprotein Lpp n=1 Tax=Spartinivicinus marinus TaxID=2994442 RepID=A0A853I2X1_9GAMM|nr:hypothetical protein [Spartinivicinus marinus]MCX4029113.1 hypothetical protein [Spartinivicinus marinus]NYZ67733.1 hypothetical protein [Spartinivicinus marinus]
MHTKMLKAALVVTTMAIMTGCASSSRVDAIEADLADVKDRLGRVEATANSADAKADQILEKLDRMNRSHYSK